MPDVRVVHDREGQTLTVWFSDPLAEFVCEEVGRGMVLINARSGQVIGIEKLPFFVPASDSVLLETTGGNPGERYTGVVMSSETLVVHSDPEILSGTPVFVGTRVPVQSLFDYIEGGDTLDEFLRQFPSVRREQAIAALELARKSLLTRAHTA